MPNFVTLDEVQALAAKWVPRLRLQDWDIAYSVEDIGEAAGSCQAFHLKQSADIKIHEGMPLVFKPHSHGARNGRLTEAVLVHELLHLYEETPGDDDAPELVGLRERLIDRFVRVLLEADAAGAWGT